MTTPAKQASHASPSTSDSAALATVLGREIDGEVRFDAGSRALYATDASLYRQVPIGVVIPRHAADVETTVARATEYGAPILMRGAGTSLAGQTCNVAVVIDTSKYMNRILDIDPVDRTAWVEPGVICDSLRDAAEAHGLTFGPDPSTHNRATIGGMVGNNACGAHSVMAGKTAENVEALEVLTVDGTRMTVGATDDTTWSQIAARNDVKGRLYRDLERLRECYADEFRRGFPTIRRRVSGYNLDSLLPENDGQLARALAGSEGTCAITLAAKVRLVDSPPHRVLLVLGYPDIFVAGDRAPALVKRGALAVEGLDHTIIDTMRKKDMASDTLDLLPAGQGWLLSEFGGATRDEAEAWASDAAAGEADYAETRIFAEPEQAARIWAIRAQGAAATNAVPGESETYPGWEDAAVDPAEVGNYLRDFKALLGRYGYQSSLYGHLGDGCIHGRITFDLSSYAGLADWRSFMGEAADLVVAYGGSLSGEHGDGQARAELLPRMYSDTIMRALGEFKAIWDPDNRLNPGKLVAPYRFDDNLRTGPDYAPAEPATILSFPRDEGRFVKAAGRCVGSGKCRRPSGGSMCPSFKATAEEAHSTRGRARLLDEMLRGDVLRGGWDSPHVKQSLDLCLACKSCKSECPVQVDMATYKAEFLAHYYQHHRRPRQALSMGRIQNWARLAGRAPGMVNALTQTPFLAGMAKKAAGVADRRSLPRFERSFQKRFGTRSNRTEGVGSAGRAILWPDTFNNHFHPNTAMAAADVLEYGGYTVDVPRGFVCCGRPLYDFGLLDEARRRLQATIDMLATEIDQGVPIIGLEPSCVTTFRDELLNFFPDDARAKALAAQTWLFTEFINQRADHFAWPDLGYSALMHGHCHQKAVLGMGSAEEVLSRLGIDWRAPDAGCCGMAGSFGFDPDKVAVSERIAETTLVPAVRAAERDTLIIADGYSCREQIAQLTGRRALHTADVMRLTLERA